MMKLALTFHLLFEKFLIIPGITNYFTVFLSVSSSLLDFIIAKDISVLQTHNCFVDCEAERHIGITLSGVCLSVRLSSSHAFVVVTHSYVSQATHAFLGMLPLFFKLWVN